MFVSPIRFGAITLGKAPQQKGSQVVLECRIDRFEDLPQLPQLCKRFYPQEKESFQNSTIRFVIDENHPNSGLTLCIGDKPIMQDNHLIPLHITTPDDYHLMSGYFSNLLRGTKKHQTQFITFLKTSWLSRALSNVNDAIVKLSEAKCNLKQAKNALNTARKVITQ